MGGRCKLCDVLRAAGVEAERRVTRLRRLANQTVERVWHRGFVGRTTNRVDQLGRLILGVLPRVDVLGAGMGIRTPLSAYDYSSECRHTERNPERRTPHSWVALQQHPTCESHQAARESRQARQTCRRRTSHLGKPACTAHSPFPTRLLHRAFWQVSRRCGIRCAPRRRSQDRFIHPCLNSERSLCRMRGMTVSSFITIQHGPIVSCSLWSDGSTARIALVNH